MSLGRRLGRLARGFVSNVDDERLREAIRGGRERSEILRDAFEAAWHGVAEEWRTGSEERIFRGEAFRENSSNHTSSTWWATTPRYTPRKYPPHILTAYHRLNLGADSSLEEVRRKRRELVKRYHPDHFVDAEQRKRAEKLTAEINAAHDTIKRHLLNGG